MAKNDDSPKVGRPSRGEKAPMIGVSVTVEERKAYKAAADKAGMKLAEWIRAACSAFLKTATNLKKAKR